MAPIRILLAEDNSAHQRLLLLSLVEGRPSVDVVIVSNRDEILAAARRGRFDCIVLDYNLPPHTAPEIIRELDAVQRDTPRIVISSSEDQRVVIESMRYGVADFVPKDEAIDGETLWKRIELLVAETRRARLERRRTNRRLKTLQQQADTDPLTGLSNRRFVERFLSGERRSDRRQSTAAVLVDLDHFKSINDTLGHDQGDEVLKSVAEVIRHRAQDADITCRWGGEEFLILRYSDSEVESWIWADDLRRAIRHDVGALSDGRGVTASIGVDVFATDAMGPDIISRADRAMYLAKESGRDRVCTWTMVELMERATALQSDPSMSLGHRLRRLVHDSSADLGATQREHTGRHGRIVRGLVERTIRAMGGLFSEDEAAAAEFHDIGKLAIPESLLEAPRALSDGERRFVDEHARFGAELFEAIGAGSNVTDVVRRHHERHDSSDVDLFTSIVGTCDALAAMMSERPYADARPVPQALAELRAERGSQFHPDVVDALHDMDLERAA